MAIGIDRDLNRTVAHLILHVGKGSAVLNQQTAKGVPEVMESESSETRVLQTGQEVIVKQVARV